MSSYEKKALTKQFVFIIGSGRSGSTWLQEMLGSHPLVCSCFESVIFRPYVVPWINAWEKEKHYGSFNGLQTLWTEEMFFDFLKGFLEKVYSKALENKPEAEIIVDKHAGYSHCVEHIDRLIPNAKFIHIIRDGRDVGVSLIEASKGWAKLWAPKDVNAAAQMWKRDVFAAFDAERYNNRYMEVRFEDLKTKGVEVLESAFTFIGCQTVLEDVVRIYEAHNINKMKKKRKVADKLTMPSGFIRKGKIGDWHESLTPIQRYKFNSVAGELLCKLGYAREPWWYDNVFQRFSVPLVSLLSSKDFGRQAIKGAIKAWLGPSLTGMLRKIRS